MTRKQHYFDWVFEVVRKVPLGRVTTYGAIADYLALGSARMVGWAMRHVQIQDNVPAHRVVNHKGELTGRHHFKPPSKMQKLLSEEGVEVENDRIIGFKDLLWVPAEHIADEDIDLEVP